MKFISEIAGELYVHDTTNRICLPWPPPNPPDGGSSWLEQLTSAGLWKRVKQVSGDEIIRVYIMGNQPTMQIFVKSTAYPSGTYVTVNGDEWRQIGPVREDGTFSIVASGRSYAGVTQVVLRS